MNKFGQAISKQNAVTVLALEAGEKKKAAATATDLIFKTIKEKYTEKSLTCSEKKKKIKTLPELFLFFWIC